MEPLDNNNQLKPEYNSDMKINTVSQKTIASEGLIMTRMGIDESSMDMIIGYLRDKIYSDKVLAPIREYISNALDAMVESCNTTDKVSVKLQSIDGSWVWSVRDYGFGLNDKDITNIFGCYGASRKRETNDQIGSYGIGAGSGFAYSDTFYVTSHHKGTKTSYACTLGKGQQGVSVGEIYKISEEPTTECGIEVSIDVKSSDVYQFSAKTSMFVKYYTPNSKLNFVDEYYDRKATPISPINSKKVGDYTFNTYEEVLVENGFSNKYFIRMGGVIYPHTHVKKNGFTYNKHIIVDVPIGKLSIPISRESIESTPLNDKVFQEIDDCLLKIKAEEVSVLTTPKFGSVISGNEEFSKTYKGDWFNYNYDSLFPKTRKWYYHAGKIFNKPEASNRKVSEGPKYAVYIMPNIKSIKNWHKRLINALTTIKGTAYNGYVFMTKANYETMLSEVDTSIDLSDCVFIDVKSLKLPKLDTVPIDKTTYQIYSNYGSKEYHSAESLDERVRENSFKGEKLEDDWYLDCKNINHLHERTVGLVKKYGTRNSGFITANSIKMVDALKELGWLTPDSVEYLDMVKSFKDKERIERTIEDAKSNLTTIYYGGKVSDKVKHIIAKKPDKIERFKKVKSAILREDSARSRILKSFSSYDRCITREDLRKILMLKA